MDGVKGKKCYDILGQDGESRGLLGTDSIFWCLSCILALFFLEGFLNFFSYVGCYIGCCVVLEDLGMSMFLCFF